MSMLHIIDMETIRETKRKCSICKHQHIDKINLALEEPIASTEKLSAFFGVSEPTLRRHKINCLGIKGRRMPGPRTYAQLQGIEDVAPLKKCFSSKDQIIKDIKEYIKVAPPPKKRKPVVRKPIANKPIIKKEPIRQRRDPHKFKTAEEVIRIYHEIWDIEGSARNDGNDRLALASLREALRCSEIILKGAELFNTSATKTEGSEAMNKLLVALEPYKEAREAAARALLPKIQRVI